MLTYLLADSSAVNLAARSAAISKAEMSGRPLCMKPGAGLRAEHITRECPFRP